MPDWAVNLIAAVITGALALGIIVVAVLVELPGLVK